MEIYVRRLSRKESGSYYTPVAVVASLLQWSIRHEQDRLLDPSCGDGVFIAGHRNAVGQIVGRVAMREWQARKDTRAVIVSLAAVWPKNIIVSTMLVIVLEKIFFLRPPFDQLAPFELVEFMTDPSRVLGARRQQEQNIMK